MFAPAAILNQDSGHLYTKREAEVTFVNNNPNAHRVVEEKYSKNNP